MSRVLAIDPGTARIGVAVSDTSRIMAFPRPYIARDEHWARTLASVIADEGVDVVLIGVPVTLSGDANAATAAAVALRTEILADTPAVHVEFVDERFTTVIAASSLRDAGVRSREHRGVVDSAAAVVLLQGYLDAQAH